MLKIRDTLLPFSTVSNILRVPDNISLRPIQCSMNPVNRYMYIQILYLCYSPKSAPIGLEIEYFLRSMQEVFLVLRVHALKFI